MNDNKINFILWGMCLILIASLTVSVFSFMQPASFSNSQQKLEIKSLPTQAPQVKERVAKTIYSTLDVSEHVSSASCWVIINNNVIDATQILKIFTSAYPKESLRYCGKDDTLKLSELFKSHPGYKSYANLLDYYAIGIVK